MKSVQFYLMSLIVLAATHIGVAKADVYAGSSLGMVNYEDADAFGVEDASSSFEMVGGVTFMDFLGVEASYLDLMEIDDYRYGGTIEISGMALALKGILPIGDRMSLYAKMGRYFWETNEYYLGELDYSDSGSDYIFGFGANFYLTNFLDLDIQYRKTDIDYMPVGIFSVGVNFILPF